MTVDEFDIWLKHHRSLYTGLSAWINKLPKVAKTEADTCRDDVMQGWYNALRDVEFNVAKRASDSMHRGDMTEPKGWDRHPGAIRAFALRERDSVVTRPPILADGEETYACVICFDMGWATVWHPIAMEAAKAGTLGEVGTLQTVAVACTCRAGQAHWRFKAKRYNPKIMLALQESRLAKVEQDRLREFMSGLQTQTVYQEPF